MRHIVVLGFINDIKNIFLVTTLKAVKDRQPMIAEIDNLYLGYLEYINKCDIDDGLSQEIEKIFFKIEEMHDEVDHEDDWAWSDYYKRVWQFLDAEVWV